MTTPNGFAFDVDFTAYSAPSQGLKQIVRDYRVELDVWSLDEARNELRSVLFEMVADAGGNLLDFPVDEIEIENAFRAPSYSDRPTPRVGTAQPV